MQMESSGGELHRELHGGQLEVEVSCPGGTVINDGGGGDSGSQEVRKQEHQSILVMNSVGLWMLHTWTRWIVGFGCAWVPHQE